MSFWGWSMLRSHRMRKRRALEIAVRLKPDSAAARTNLAASLSRQEIDLAGEAVSKGAELEPRDYDANHNLGEFYIQSGKIAEAVPLLEQAQQIDPTLTTMATISRWHISSPDELSQARQLVQNLVATKNTGELHNLLAQIEEKDGKFVAAANEYQIAAHMDPSEDNLFDWGSELLLHRTYEPAIEVFRAGDPALPEVTPAADRAGHGALFARQI